MTVDLEAIARRSGCEVSSLKLALPLVEQGFSPPFLARYRRDELSGLSEPALWMLQRQVRSERTLAARRQELTQIWERTRLSDLSIRRAIQEARGKGSMNRAARRLKSETVDPNANISPALWVASRILNPQPGDPTEIEKLAEAVGQGGQAAEIAAALEPVLTKRLADHPQIVATAVRWLNNNASIKFLEVSDPNIDTSVAEASTPESALDAAHSDRPRTEPGEHWPSPEQLGGSASASESVSQEPPTSDASASAALTPDSPAQIEATSSDPLQIDPAEIDPASTQVTVMVGVFDPAAEGVEPVVVTADGTSPPADESASGTGKKGGRGRGKGEKAKVVKKTKVLKKLSPRQRRRRWLIGILQPLVGKQIPIKRMSAFQTIVLSRALRGNLVRCQFVYDANQLVAQLQKTATQINPAMASMLEKTIADNESVIRDATETVWWDELQEDAIADLVELTARHLDTQLHRGSLEAKTILAIDAVGPRTSPVAIVSSDGRVLHTEDVPCQLETEFRSGAVTRLGELIHRYGVDLIVVSNGPARRATLVILGELIAQSPEGSIRWTIAERSGADAYSGSEMADREMRTTPRRFRAATWLAFSLLKPAWALAKVNPTRLRLSSAQRELPEDALSPILRDVMASAISRGGLDVNSAPIDALTQLPGITRPVAEAIDRRRRQSLISSRQQISELEEWPDEMNRRQAIGFLRVFGGSEPLDATVIHPEDYSLARRLSKALSIELPPSSPPGYEPPRFDEPPAPAAAEPVRDPELGDIVDLGDDAQSDFAAELQQGADGGEAAQVPVAVTEEAAPGEAAEVASSVEAVAAAVESPGADAGAAEAPAAEAPASEAPVAASTVRRPLPEPAAINKCIREWQVGSNRAHRIVQALCDPFGEEAVAATSQPPVVMTKVPKPSHLRSGDPVIGVVASVAPFGAFIEISPESTGLIRVSRLAEEFVEEIHDYIQVGDVVSAWVTEVDSKRKLQLSAISPAREEQLRREREEQRDRRGSYRGGDSRRGGGQQGGAQGGARGGNQGQSRGEAGQGQAQGRDGQRGDQRREGAAAEPRGGQQRGRGGQPIGRPPGSGDNAGRGGSPDQRRGDRPQGGGRGQGQGDRGPRRDRDQRGDGRGREGRERHDEPTSYQTRVPRNQPATPISEAMAEGREPLRSFGDLLQYFKKDQPQPPAKKEATKPKDDDDVSIESNSGSRVTPVSGNEGADQATHSGNPSGLTDAVTGNPVAEGGGTES